MGDEDGKTNGNKLGTRQGTLGGRIMGLGWRVYFVPPTLTWDVHVTHPGKVPNSSKSPGNAISWCIG